MSKQAQSPNGVGFVSCPDCYGRGPYWRFEGRGYCDTCEKWTSEKSTAATGARMSKRNKLIKDAANAWYKDETLRQMFTEAAKESMPDEPARDYSTIACDIADTVKTKQAAYGDSFGKSGEVMRVLYPNGIPADQMDDALAVVRLVDKLFRVATDRDALGESPWRDIAGYALLAVERVERK